MKSEWKSITLGEVASVKGGKRLPKGMSLITEPNEHPYIRIRDLTGKTLELNSSYEYVDDETQKSIARYIVEYGDIIISIVGTIGLVSVIGRSLHCANLTENCAKIVEISENVDKDYLYYYLVSPLGQEEIRKGTVGAVQPKLPLKNIQAIKIVLPPISEQQKISSILGQLDEKIENNKKINDNLLQQAQAIYASMFATNADPSWPIGHLSDLITVKYGKDHKKLADGPFPVYGSGGIMRYVEQPLYTQESVLIPRKGTLNNVMYVSEPFWSVDTMFYSEMRIPNIAKYVYHFLRGKDLASMNAGSAVPSMTTDILNSMELVIPPQNVLEEFETKVEAMYKMIQANICESEKLGNIRDTLLPRFLSREIDTSSITL